MEREWYPGYKGKTSKGGFLVLKENPESFLVQYTSGEWKGRFVSMPKIVGEKVSKAGFPELTKKQQEKFLDLFYSKYPDLYEELWHEGITTRKMVSLIEEEHPNLFELVFREFTVKGG